MCDLLQFVILLASTSHIPFLKSNERSEYSYGPGDFFFFQKKVLKCSKNYRYTSIHIQAFMNALLELSI